MKKILAVATALVLAISSLCVFVVADDTVTIDGSSYTVVATDSTASALTSGNQNWLVSYSGAYTSYLATSGAMIYVDYTASSDASWVQMGLQYSVSGSYPSTDAYSATSYFTASNTVAAIAVSDIASGSSYDISNCYQIWIRGDSNVTINSVSIVIPDTSSSSSTAVDTSSWQLALNGFNTSWEGWNSVYESAGTLTVSATIADIMNANGITSTSELGGFIAQVWNISSEQDGAVTYSYTLEINGAVYASGTDVTVSLESGTLNVKQVQDTTIWGDYDFASLTGSEVVTFTVYDVKAISTSASDEPPVTSKATVTGTIYINEEYHGIFVTRNGRKFLMSIPHTVDANGYCTGCGEYIGTGDEEVATTSINGGEYVEAYSKDLSFYSSGWDTYDLGDTSLVEALSIEGSILVFTRNEETNIVFGDDTYEKLGLVNSWWSGEWMQLGTAGNTSADEPDAGIIDCISDDGTTIIYDGATVYNEWVSRGMNAGGTALLVTNTSGSYKITNVTVYVPAGTVIEEVAVDEPAEDTNTETEDDELDVDDNDAEEVTETNPTTGAVLALVPMAIAGFAVVASKRK